MTTNISSLLRMITLFMGGYLYLINEKYQSLKMFKIYNAEVENQLNRKIKVVSLTVVVRTMADTIAQVDVQDFLLIF